jgi:hypothetical protein
MLPPLRRREARTAGLSSDTPHFTKRFAFHVGRRCRQASIRDVALELKLDWDTAGDAVHVAQLKRAGTPGPRTIGIDEILIAASETLRPTRHVAVMAPAAGYMMRSGGSPFLDCERARRWIKWLLVYDSCGKGRVNDR